MSRLNEAQQQSIDNLFAGWLLAAAQPAPTPPDADRVATPEQRLAYAEQLRVYNSNPILSAIRSLETRYHDIHGRIENGRLILQGGNTRDEGYFTEDFNTHIANMRKNAIEGTLSISDFIRVPTTVPGLGTLQNMVTNPGSIPGSISNMFSSIGSMLNPMNWLPSIWEIAKKIPIVDDFSGAVSELLSGRKFSLENGRMRQAMGRMFSYITDATARERAINDAMVRYLHPPVVVTPVTPTPNPSVVDASILHNAKVLSSMGVVTGQSGVITDLMLVPRSDAAFTSADQVAQLLNNSPDAAIRQALDDPNKKHILVKMPNNSVAIVSGSESGGTFTPSHVITIQDGRLVRRSLTGTINNFSTTAGALIAAASFGGATHDLTFAAANGTLPPGPGTTPAGVPLPDFPSRLFS